MGLFGGAFDPPHEAHRALAQIAVESLQLDRLYLVPTGQAWHKSRPLSPSYHRLAMTRLAFEGVRNTVIDERELNHSGPSYTVDTLASLRTAHDGADFFLLMGADQAAKFSSWHNWAQIASWAQLVVADRSMEEGTQMQPLEWHNLPDTKAVPLHMPLMPISATDIRRQIKLAKVPDAALRPSVRQYIQQHHLYTDQHD